MSSDNLYVEFAGEEFTVVDRLTFGRVADLEVDENQYMHRLVGEFVLENGLWWVRNLGSHIHLTVVAETGIKIELPPKMIQSLSAGPGVIRFSAGPTNYEITYVVPEIETDDGEAAESFGENTTKFALIFTPREVDFMVTFAKDSLDGRDVPLPTYAEVASLWGVSPKTLDNTVQGIKRKLRHAGIARDEPLQTLIPLVIRHGLITRADLEWANLDSGEPESSVTGPRFTA